MPRDLDLFAFFTSGHKGDPFVPITYADYPNIYENLATGTSDGQRISAGLASAGTGTSDGGDAAIGTGSQLAAAIRSRRLSATGADQSAGWSSGVANGLAVFWRGNAAGLGGFLTQFQFGLSQFTQGHQAFVGMRASIANIDNTDPIDLVDCVGIGVDPGDTSWSIFHNDATGQCTKYPLGIAVNTAELLELTIVAPSNGSTISWVVRNLDAGTQRSGVITSNMPAATTFLSHHTWANTGAVTGTPVRIDLVEWVIGTSFPSVDASNELGLNAWDNLMANVPAHTTVGARNGLGLPSTFIGTVTQPAPAAGSLFSSWPHTRMASTAAANSTASMRAGAGYHYRGDVAGRGGFCLRILFSWETYASGNRAFIGLRNTNTDISTAEPDALINIIGVGVRSDQTRWRILHNDGSGTATAIDPGANFDVTNQHVLELRIVALANASSVAVRLRNLTTGQVDTRTLSSDLPLNTGFLGYHVHSNTAAITTSTVLCVGDVRINSPHPLLAA